MSFTLTLIFFENTVISSLGKRLSCRQVKKRKREESSKEGKAKRWRFGELYFSAEKHCEPQQINCKKTHCVFFVLAGSRVISGIMYIMAAIKKSPQDLSVRFVLSELIFPIITAVPYIILGGEHVFLT